MDSLKNIFIDFLPLLPHYLRFCNAKRHHWETSFKGSRPFRFCSFLMGVDPHWKGDVSPLFYWGLIPISELQNLNGSKKWLLGCKNCDTKDLAILFLMFSYLYAPGLLSIWTVFKLGMVGVSNVYPSANYFHSFTHLKFLENYSWF